jgi:hypothetical protein
MHGKWEDNYDDPFHPIPSLTALDIEGIKKGGGANLTIVIASPLQADERSQRRLLSKIELYLGYLPTSQFQSKSGVSTPENTSIIIKIHPRSDPLVLDLIERCKPWVFANNATLKAELLSSVPTLIE